ncbi:MAG: O-antigen ligase family protein [Saprospiraceae bacterium]|nr:O-antigen ligase family protein [Saprospiraceae bacterium]
MISKSKNIFIPGVVFILASLVIPFLNIDSIINDKYWPKSLSITKSILDTALWSKFLAVVFIMILFSIVIFILQKKKAYFETGIVKNNAFLFYLGFIVISLISIFKSTLVSEAIVDVLKNFVFLVYFIVGVLLISKQENTYKFISKFICVFGLTAAIIGLLQIIILLPGEEFNHQFTYLITATFSQRNLYAQVLILSFPFAAFLIVTDKKIWRWIAIVSASVELLIIILLLVRSVWLALALSTFFSVILLFVFYKSFQINGKLIRNLLLISFAFAIIIFSSLFVYTKLDSTETLKKQAYWLKNDPFGSVKERYDMWNPSVEMIKDKPLLGFGAGNWKIILPKYANKEIREVNKGNYTNFQRTHNDYLQVASETGILGLIAYLLIFFAIIYYIFKIIKLSKNQDEKLFALFMFFGILSYMIISFFSFPKERISHSIILNLMFISVVALYHRIKKPGKNLNPKIFKLIFIPVFLILVLALLFGIKRINGEKHSVKAFDYRCLNNNQAVIMEIEKAYSCFYQIDPTSTPLKWYSGTAWFFSGNLNKAYNDFNESYKTNPYHKQVINDLATSYELMGNHEMSVKLYKEAISISPQFDEALINLAIVKYNEGKIDSAYNYLRNCKPETENEKYYAALKVFLPIITKNYIEQQNDELLKSTFYRFLDSEDWLLKIHKHSVIEKHEYKLQLIKEAIFLLEEVDSTITTEKADDYKKMYGLNN